MLETESPYALGCTMENLHGLGVMEIWQNHFTTKTAEFY